MIRPEQMPYKNAMGKTYDSGQFESVMDQAVDARRLARVSSARRRREDARPPARPRHRDVPRMDRRRRVRGARDGHRVTATGDIEIFSATQAMGQGLATTFAQLAVDVFGVPIEKIRIVQGDTDRGTGFGSAGSRSLFVGGSAVHVASERTVEKAQELGREGARGGGRRHRVSRRRVPHRRHRPQHRPLRSRASAAGGAHRARLDEHGRRRDVAQRLPHLRSRDRSGHRRGRGRRPTGRSTTSAASSIR